ncbi:MAG: hypothetical protein ACTHNS_02585, partial [Marmoricola sp.]
MTESVGVASRWMDATLVAACPLIPGMCEITLEVDSWPGHLAGQHVDIRVPGSSRWQRPHSYSIGNAPGTGGMPFNWLRLAVPVEKVNQLDPGGPGQVGRRKGERVGGGAGE